MVESLPKLVLFYLSANFIKAAKCLQSHSRPGGRPQSECRGEPEFNTPLTGGCQPESNHRTALSWADSECGAWLALLPQFQCGCDAWCV